MGGFMSGGLMGEDIWVGINGWGLMERIYEGGFMGGLFMGGIYGDSYVGDLCVYLFIYLYIYL